MTPVYCVQRSTDSTQCGSMIADDVNGPFNFTVDPEFRFDSRNGTEPLSIGDSL